MYGQYLNFKKALEEKSLYPTHTHAYFLYYKEVFHKLKRIRMVGILLQKCIHLQLLNLLKGIHNIIKMCMDLEDNS